MSATPGIGKVRDTAPAVTTTMSYSNWVGSPSSGSIVAILFAWSMLVTLAVMMRVFVEVTAVRDDGVP